MLRAQGTPYNISFPPHPVAGVMSTRWINILFPALVACTGMVHAQDEPAPSVESTMFEQQPAAPETATPAGDMQPATQDTVAAPDNPGSSASDTAVTPVESQQMAPAAIPTTGPVATPGNDDRLRSMFILGSAVVLVVTLVIIIVLLVKRGREGRQGERRYVAEAYLRDISGNTSQSMYRLGSKPVMLGRVGGKDTEFLDYIVVPSATIGRRHALIEFKDFGYWIMDQGSINGTFVNGRPVSAEVRLKHGDRIKLHKLEFEFVMPEVGESSATVLAHGVASAGTPAAAAASAGSDFVLDLEPEQDSGAPADGGDLEQLRESVESEEATLLPGSSSLPAPAPDSGEETLLPAGGGAAGGAGTPDETLLPASGTDGRGDAGSGRAGQGKKKDEFFDITGGD